MDFQPNPSIFTEAAKVAGTEKLRIVRTLVLAAHADQWSFHDLIDTLEVRLLIAGPFATPAGGDQ